MEAPEERSLLSHLEASPAFWSSLISRTSSLLVPVPPVSSEAQRDFYPMASKYCPVQYTALAGKRNRRKKMGKIVPQPPSQELPRMVRESLKLEIPPSVPSLEKESTQVPCWQVRRRTSVDWPSSGLPGYREAGPCLSPSFQGLRKPLLHPCPRAWSRCLFLVKWLHVTSHAPLRFLTFPLPYLHGSLSDSDRYYL